MRRLLLVVFLILPACSPEEGRTRGQGRGADVGNYGGRIELREGPQHYHGTPDRKPGP
jgi:hypothetical protein